MTTQVLIIFAWQVLVKEETRSGSSLYLESLNPEPEGPRGAHVIPEVHVAQLGDSSVLVLLASGCRGVHLDHLRKRKALFTTVFS